MATSHCVGFPRIGKHRELKKATEAYWRGDLDQSALMAEGKRLRSMHWRMQQNAGMDRVATGDFAWYDQMLNHSLMLGAIPQRFRDGNETNADNLLDTLFRMARGRAPTGKPAAACEMTKWFDTNYHYIVPELHKGQTFQLTSQSVIEETAEAIQQGFNTKPVLIGPLTWLWLGKIKGESFDRLELLNSLIDVYGQVLEELAKAGADWVHIDEPVLVLDLPQPWLQACENVYNRLQNHNVKIMLATYFGGLNDATTTVVNLPVEGLHVDLVRAPEQLLQELDRLPAYKTLSVGVIDGRNIWRSDLSAILEQLKPAREKLGDRLWVSSSCSLLHVPVDLSTEEQLDDEIKSWLSFAVQKCEEVAVLGRALSGDSSDSTRTRFTLSDAVACSRKTSRRVHRKDVEQSVSAITPGMMQRQSPYAKRHSLQREKLNLPLFPTTTIGSFPQTSEIRRQRSLYRKNQLSNQQYLESMQQEIQSTIKRQESLGLDVLVHGEAERNDMVEYFGEQLDGFAFTEYGWVQSYGSRCVKPPIIYGDISRPAPMTVTWSVFAQQQTDKVMKGMLTGPVTILCWSFTRDDIPEKVSCEQLALALREEVVDLEQAGIQVIQIDEPAIREGLPLRKADWPEYLDWAVNCFRLSASGVKDETQIHTHMCYSEFNDIIEYIAAMDADVITIETSRSDMELLDAFEEFEYPNEIGPGVYDIHSPNVPERSWMKQLMQKAAEKIPAERLWINPDCGLKTRDWPEVEEALSNMVQVARELRAEY
ncbi:5-methyltetrahydropteroyltriglutamate--homocysteine methyltransferase [Endozoicomonas montiporae]|uniref:5-methyltetrahydropteroyltriglutamate--homocysteine methyltransferase n=2 Tax=Endozoicomonas montiporae TaxID=1027273 RepID=A0A081N2P5_9GAMM|nr:5-methyltetrahydropteroyltriglutamate--homocysteine S-methyltransferase [Endozoicomonas montiporae]AMO57976.1 5-methyltetrahydropteroyltriglutamate/homocysteine S-methyltransferase [Endozoicomonas montiporae CL-33]KEQ12718.1 5-methyltetrahydropteroyltriglutamate--homocysteine methyltransferase [Endozoicomonas montiporae]